MRKRGIAAVAVVGAVAACSQSPRDTPFVADVGRCLSVDRESGPRSTSCPDFLASVLAEAREVCVSAGGHLAPGPRPILTGIDVNGDDRQEFLFRPDENVICEGAWSVFSCGSLGCPFTLYEEHRGAWRPIGAIDADAPESIALIGTARIDGHRQLRVGCSGGGTCAEYSFYSRVGDHYEHTHMEARGFRVDVARSLHGLYPLVSETALLTTPAADGVVIDRYHADTEVAIVGTAASSDYYYVSPCNACERGFVRKSDVLVRQ